MRRGAIRVYAATRRTASHPDPRVTPVALDVTDAAQIRAAAQRVESLDVLINNAGVALYDDLTDPAVLEAHLRVNLFGPYAVTQAFLPLLTRSRGALVNNLSVNALGSVADHPGVFGFQGGRVQPDAIVAGAAGRAGCAVHAVLTGPVDTDMTRGLDIPKAAPESVARAVFEGLEEGQEDIFPDPLSQSIAQNWGSGAAKALERQYAALAQPQPAT